MPHKSWILSIIRKCKRYHYGITSIAWMVKESNKDPLYFHLSLNNISIFNMKWGKGSYDIFHCFAHAYIECNKITSTMHRKEGSGD